MECKIAGDGLRYYWESGWNRLDATLVAISLFEIAYSAATAAMEEEPHTSSGRRVGNGKLE